MKITYIIVSSIDGKLTKNFDPHITKWTSKEDQKHFQNYLKQSSLILMGHNTYEASRPIIKLTPDTLRIVLTSTPAKFRSHEVKGQLEFTDESPKALIERLSKIGYEEMLHVGGGETANSFFKENLITDILLTLEPKVFGKGTPSCGTQEVDCTFKLISIDKLNDQGTLLLHYRKSEYPQDIPTE